ncbi:hypothetical protein CBOM_08131 [Ceraceosorus bombacis]|uniref:Uncharacterized protein n=1 Tax=Ceraceosorus bombacis TaxID=401625 RepID=A0A0P1B7F5_9BASI|nr:hypothetical protein CBOM_08131 [Ceraceosorus bombacis]
MLRETSSSFVDARPAQDDGGCRPLPDRAWLAQALQSHFIEEGHTDPLANKPPEVADCFANAESVATPKHASS